MVQTYVGMGGNDIHIFLDIYFIHLNNFIQMNKIELINYWIETSDRDYNTMINLYNSGDYHWSLFMGHLVIEKLLKVALVKNNDGIVNPPKTHNLTLLADKAGIQTINRNSTGNAQRNLYY